MEVGKTRNEWLESINAADYDEMLELAQIEPVGNDAIIEQIARLCASFGSGNIEDYLVLSTYHEKTPEQLARSMGWPGP